MLKRLLFIHVFVVCCLSSYAQKDWYIGTNASNTIIRPIGGGLYIAPEIRYKKDKVMPFFVVGYESVFTDKKDSKTQISEYASKGFFTRVGIDFMPRKKSFDRGGFTVGLGLTYSIFQEKVKYEFEGNAFPGYLGKSERKNISSITGDIHYGYWWNRKNWMFYLGATHGLSLPSGIPQGEESAFPSYYMVGSGINIATSQKNRNWNPIFTSSIEFKVFFKISPKE